MRWSSDIESPWGAAVAPSAEITTEPLVPDQPTSDLTLDASADPPPPPAPVPLAGDLVGAYRIAALAGSGGMGVVYRARDEQLDRWVALKLIAPEYARDPRFREMFLRESRAAAAIEHPNVIPVYRADEDGERLYIAMRLVEGESLAEIIARRGRIPPAQAARVLGQISSALDAAHRKGLLHRDVKPANILVSAEEDGGTAYLSDFGLATRFVQDAAGGRWAGTLAYLAPEQIRGGTLDARTDVYALGCVLFQALTGRVPFPTRDEKAAQIAHLTEAPPRVSDVAPGVPAGFDAVVARAMAKRPEDRFPSARAFGDALAALRFDAVLVHHPDDTDAAVSLRAALRADGLEVWEPTPGSEDIADALRAAGACLVLVGRAGIGAWAREPLALAQEIALRDRAFRIGAALLPGCPDPFGPEMAFLAGRQWADLRLGTDDRDGRRELARLVREEAPPAPVGTAAELSPYRGLTPFGRDDAAMFVGREDEVSGLLERLRTRRFLAVVGPSGGGKSSLLGAGLLPALATDAGADWRVATLTPGARPLAGLAAAVAPLLPAANPPSAGEMGTDPTTLRRALEDAMPADGDARVLILVDQFEEAFTLAEADERTAFLDALCDAATLPGGRVWVVAAIRADFYPRCAEHDALRDLVSANQFLLGPMGPAALRRAIEVPARRAGLVLEPGLTRRILNDLAGRPGALPLLQHLLLELWHRRRGREMTLEAYAASGGVEGALARRADEVHAALSPDQRALARRILLRLTQPGEGTEDTRRRAEMRELVVDAAEHADVDAVVGAFTAARLFTTGRDAATGRPTVEVAHEALIRGWPRLRRWLADERDELRAQHRLTQAADEWERAGRDEGQLYRGARLAEWRERARGALNDRERGFLEASEDREDREDRARRRRTRTAFAGLAAGLVLVGGAGGFAVVQRNNATDARAVAQSRQLAANAREQVGRDPELAVLLAQEAIAADPTADARWALRQAAFNSPIIATLPHPGGITRIAISGDGRTMLSGGNDGVIRSWDLGSRRAAGTLPGDAVFVLGLDVDAGGGRYAVTSGSTPDTFPRRVDVRSVDGGTLLRRVSSPGTRSAAISPDGRLVASAGGDGRVRVWEVDGTGPGRVIGALPDGVVALAFSPDGTHVAAGGFGPRGGAAGVWRADGGGGRTIAAGVPLGDVAFAPDGRSVAATGFSTPDIYRWEWATAGAPPSRTRTDAAVLGVAWSPDGRWIATTASDGGVSIRPAGGGDAVTLLRGHAGGVYTAAFRGSSDELVTGGDDGARVWSWGRGVPERADIRSPEGGPGEGRLLSVADGGAVTALLPDGRSARWAPDRAAALVGPAGTPGPVNDGVVGPGGRALGWTTVEGALTITARGDRPAVARNGFWTAVDLTPDAASAVATTDVGEVLRWDAGPGRGPEAVGKLESTAAAVRISANGSTVLASDFGGAVVAWPSVGGGPVPLNGHSGAVAALDLTADGSLAATGSADRTVRVWDTRSGRQLAVLRGHDGAVDTVVRFSGDGRLVLSAAADGLRLWDWRAGAEILDLPVERPNQAAVSSDGRWIAALVPRRGTYRLLRWRCDVCGGIDEVADLARARVTRSLTDGERDQFGLD